MITLNYEKSIKYDKNLVENKIMGPNPLKLVEELLVNHNISDYQPAGSPLQHSHFPFYLPG